MVFGPIYAGGIITALAARMSGERISLPRGDPRRPASLGPALPGPPRRRSADRPGLPRLHHPGNHLRDPLLPGRRGRGAGGRRRQGSRRRSTYLTRGRSLLIFLGGLLYLAAILTFSWLLNWALEFASPDGYPFLSAAGLCLIDVLTVFFTCLFFLIYWEARQDELERQAISSAKLSPERRRDAPTSSDQERAIRVPSARPNHGRHHPESAREHIRPVLRRCDLHRLRPLPRDGPGQLPRNDAGGHSFVVRQPEGPAQEAACAAAMEECPVEAIGDDGLKTG